MAEHMAGEQKRLRDEAPDISTWTIVLFGARSFLGIKGEHFEASANGPETFKLDPAYEIHRSPQQVNPRQMAIVNFVAPILWHSSMPSVWIPVASAIMIPVKDLSPNEIRDWAASVKQCEERSKAMRAQDAGIQLAGANALNGIPRPGSH